MAKVSKLSKAVKTDIVHAICAPSYKKREELKQDITAYLNEKYNKSLPQGVQEFITKYPEYINSVYIYHYGTYTYSCYIESISKKEHSKYTTNFMNDEEIKHLEKLIKKLEDYKKEINTFAQEIRAVLELSVKQIIETFPDIAHLIPDRSSPTPLNLPMVKVESVTFKIQNQPL